MNGTGKLGILFVVVVFFANIGLMEIASAGQDERQPPPTRRSDVLTEQVYRAINEISELMSPEDPDDEPNYDEALERLDRLRDRRWERMNDFEKSTTLNFYTNYYLSTDNIPEAIRIFEELLTIETLREDIQLRSLRALGQLLMAVENFEQSIVYYMQWRDVSLEEDDLVFLGLANSHYSIEQYSQAVPYLIDHMEMLADAGEDIARNKWGLLNVLYIEQEDYVSALEITKNMVVQFGEMSDWRNLSAMYSYLEQDSNRVGSLSLRYLQQIMESETEYLNLAQSLAGEDAPYTGAKILQAGIDAGVVEEDEDTLFTLIQMYQLASEFGEAVTPATKYAEMVEGGDGYDTLGYVYYVLRDYEAAAQAFRDAIDKGQLSDAADTNLFLARALVEFDEYDEAAAATRLSADLGDESERNAANSYLRFIEGQHARYNAIQGRKNNVLDFYISYDD